MENYYFKHPSHFGDMFGIFEDFYRSKTLSDVIISCNGRQMQAHRMVLCAGSDYFRKVLTSIKVHNHLPVLIINEITYEDMEIILEFIYRGQIVVPRQKVDSLRQAAYRLRVKGFENFLRKPFCPPGVAAEFAAAAQVPESRNRYDLMKNGPIPYDLLAALTNEERHRLQNRLSNGDKATKEETFEKMLSFLKNRSDGGQKRKHQSHFRSSQLEAALQRSAGNRNSLLKSKAGPSPIPFGQKSPQTPFDSNGTMNLKMNNKRQHNSAITNGHHSANDFCDENEDNQKNETTENAIENGNRRKEYDSEDDEEVNGVNYTYEMDPNSLMTAQWDVDDVNPEEADGSSSKDENEPMEDEDYYESLVPNPATAILQQAALATMNNQALQSMNANSVTTYSCDHCPKFFYDEDHLQLHIKRTHGLNKLNQCDICGKAYAWKSGLYKHKRHVHGIGGPNGTTPTNGAANGKEPSPAPETESGSGSHPATPASQSEVAQPYSLEALRMAVMTDSNRLEPESPMTGSSPTPEVSESTGTPVVPFPRQQVATI